MERKQIKRAVLSAITMGALALSAIPAAATEMIEELIVEAPLPQAEQHCLATVASNSRGVIEIGPQTCFETEKEVDGFIRDGRNTSAAASRSSSQTIGRHYTNTGYSGSSITIVGTGCSGGTWNPSGGWNNNIESSKNYCGGSGTKFYNSSSCSGSGKTIYGNKTSLGWMNNKTSCVRYG